MVKGLGRGERDPGWKVELRCRGCGGVWGGYERWYARFVHASE